jgi:hypothetical protein
MKISFVLSCIAIVAPVFASPVAPEAEASQSQVVSFFFRAQHYLQDL